MNMTKIGIVSQFDPHTDKRAHSGILYKINEAIEKVGIETVWIKNPLPWEYKIICKIFGLLNRLGINHGVYLDRTIIGAKMLARTIDYEAAKDVDYVMAIHYFHVPAFGRIGKPIIYHSDATFELANNYYLHNMPRWNVRQAEKIEKMALAHSTWHLSSSEWRENSVVNHYGINRKQCAVLEYGSCIDTEGIRRTPLNDGILHLLFMGVDWERKGGEIAVETTRLLNERGIKTVLTVMGLKVEPDSCKNREYINLVGFLNKNTPAEYERMKTIFRTTDILLLPTKAECSAVVFCEAADYGTAVVTYDTGGVVSYVKNGLNGSRLPEGSPASAFADEIERIWKSEGELDRLSEGARKMSVEKLNWNNWTKWFKENVI